jgi:hypothetical protein
VLTDALVVLSFGQDLVVGAVGEHEYRALDARKKLLDDYLGRGVAEHTTQHLLKLFLGLLQRGKDEHALAGCQTVGLEHIGSLQGLQKAQTLLNGGAVEGGVGRRGDVVALHEGLGEILASLEHGTLTRGTDDGDGGGAHVVLEVVVDAVDQRILGAYDDHVDLMRKHEVLQPVEIVDADGHVLAHGRRTGIARSNVELVTFLTLSDLPCQCMLTPATS